MTSVDNEIVKIIAGGDIAIGLLKFLDGFETGEELFISCQIQNELIACLADDEYEEEIWNQLLSIMPVKTISDKLIQHCIRSKIALVAICHMPLDDKWLLELTDYDDAPIYTLSKRYYLLDKYSDFDFVKFYNKVLFCKHEILQYLLEKYRGANRRKLLIFLCLSDERIEDKSQVKYHQVADWIRTLSDSRMISSAYEKYCMSGIVMREIADNYYTPNEILNKLSVIKEISFANEIRKKSKNTLQIKKYKLGERV